MKKLLIVLILFLPNPLIFASNNISDYFKDENYFETGLKKPKCPGPHFKKLHTYTLSENIQSLCVDKDSIIKLTNGGRARFVLTFSIYKDKVFQGLPKVEYKSYWYQVDCEKGLDKRVYGYALGDFSLGKYSRPLFSKPGWYEFMLDEDGGVRNVGISFMSRPFGSLTPSQLITTVSAEAKFFCKDM